MAEGGADAADGISEDALLRGRIRLLQPKRGHRAGTDAILVAALADPEPGDLVVDLGAGTGAVGLIIAARVPGIRCVFVESDPFLAGLCRDNLDRNGFADLGAVVEADVLAPLERCEDLARMAGRADLVVTNPPFAEADRGTRSPQRRRAAAHVLPVGGFGRWIDACAGLLRPKGRLALIQRADRLADCLDHLRAGFGDLRIWPVYPKGDSQAIRVLVTAVRGSRGPMSLQPPLVLHAPDGSFTSAIERLHRGEALAGAR